MRWRLIAAGTRLPGWVNAGYDDYASRFGPELRLELREIAVTPRGRGADLARARAREGERMLAAIDPGMYVVALEVGGRALGTEALAQWLAERQRDGRDVALMIGGPDGLAPECVARADWKWSLSPLTFPHALVRLLVVEQLYRAHSILKNHPYHRGSP
jgi:23S rRNA (pseudouridine1915-N3)-methyltransferase